MEWNYAFEFKTKPNLRGKTDLLFRGRDNIIAELTRLIIASIQPIPLFAKLIKSQSFFEHRRLKAFRTVNAER
jgi:hypothetical protein